MIRYFGKILGAHFRDGRALYALTVLGVALGVAAVLAVQVINLNATAAFSGSIRAVSGDAEVSVLGATPSLDETVLREVLSTPGVERAWPLVQRSVAVSGDDRFYLDVVGFDLFAPVSVPLSHEVLPEDPVNALATPGWVAISPRLAADRGWSVGDTVVVTSGSRSAVLTIGTLVDFQSATPLASSRLVTMDIAHAQSLFGTVGRIDQIDVQVRDGVAPDRLASLLRDRLGPGVRVLTPDQRGQEAAGLLSAFRLNLTALSLISIFVGVFLVHSAAQTALVRRRREFGILRSLGATRGQVFGLILSEITLLGLLGVSLGLPLGLAVANANLDLVSATLTNLYLLEEIESLVLPWWIYGLGVVVGLGGAVAGALGPALDMSRRDTKSLLAAFTLHERTRSRAPALFTTGLAILGIAAVGYLTLGREWQHSGFALAAALLVGLPLLTPLLVHRLGAVARTNAFDWRFALKSLSARLQTTAFAAAALTVAVAMLVGITLMVGSFRETLDLWIADTVRADVFVTTESWRGETDETILDDRVISAVRARADVRAVDRLRSFSGFVGDRSVSILGVDFELEGGEPRFAMLEGSTQGVARDGAVLVSEPFFRKTGVGPGDRLEIRGPNGLVRPRIAGVYYDYSTERGAVAMDLRTMTEYFGPGGTQSIAVYLSPGVDPEAVIDELRAAFPDVPLIARSNSTLRDEALRVFDQTFAITRILQAMSLLIAAAGITLALLVLAREKQSELALYRALGATRRQVFSLFVGKGIGIAGIGLFLGGLGGVALAGILIYVTNRAYFGWTIQAHLPAFDLAQQAGTILTAALLASLYPAMRASRTPAAELSRENL